MGRRMVGAKKKCSEISGMEREGVNVRNERVKKMNKRYEECERERKKYQKSESEKTAKKNGKLGEKLDIG